MIFTCDYAAPQGDMLLEENMLYRHFVYFACMFACVCVCVGVGGVNPNTKDLYAELYNGRSACSGESLHL